MTRTVTDEVIVLGAGIVGICCALSLSERGLKVRIIDRDEPGQAASHGNAGIVSPWSIIPQSLPGLAMKVPGLMVGPHRPLSVHPAFWPKMIPWGLKFLRNGTEDRVRALSDAMEQLCGPSIDLYRRHLAGTGQDRLLQDSMYVHAFREAEKADPDAIDYRIRREKGAEIERIGAADLRDLEPALSPDYQAAILIKGQARALAPGRIATALARKAQGQGVTLTRAAIDGLRQDDGVWSVACAGTSYSAKQVVVALGAWSVELLAKLGLTAPLVAERGYHLEFTAPGVQLNNSVMDMDTKFVASSMEDGLRVAGTAEFAALDAPASPGRWALMKRQAQAALPDLNTGLVREWMGARPSLPDSLPMLGEIDGKPGLYASFGHSHYGLMMAPKSGEIVADIVSGRPVNIDLSPYAPSRHITPTRRMF